jgi:hypothetical protein
VIRQTLHGLRANGQIPARFGWLLGLLGSFVLAQSSAPTTAVGWLDAARNAHGGQALVTLLGYKESGVFRIAATSNQPQVDGSYTIHADLSANRYRREIVIGNVRFVQQFANNAGFAWTSSASRKETAPASVLPLLKAPLYQGWLGLRLTTRDTSSLLGTQTFGTVSGTAVNTTTNSVQAQWLFSSTNELVAEKLHIVGFGPLVAEYRNFQFANAIKIPRETRLLNGSNLVATQITQSTSLNPIWSSGDFAEP